MTLNTIAQRQQPKDALASENTIHSLRFSDHFQQDMMKTQPEGLLIPEQIAHLEVKLYHTLFISQIDSLQHAWLRLEAQPCYTESFATNQELLVVYNVATVW